MCPKETLTQKYQAHFCEILRWTNTSGELRDVKAIMYSGEIEKSIYIKSMLVNPQKELLKYPWSAAW